MSKNTLYARLSVEQLFLSRVRMQLKLFNECGDSLMVKRGDQHQDGGSSPTSSLHFERCSLKNVSKFIKKFHYSHTLIPEE